MAISPVSASMMSIYVPSLSTSSSDAQKDYEYQLIIQELMAMGIAATGDKTTDKARLDIAKRMQECKHLKATAKGNQFLLTTL